MNNSVATGEDIDGSGLGDAIWKGGVAGAVGGGVGAYIGPGAFGAMGGGFAGGATGSALNGGNRWEILQGGLMGAGVSLSSTLVDIGLRAETLNSPINQTASEKTGELYNNKEPELTSEKMDVAFDDFAAKDAAAVQRKIPEAYSLYNKDGNYMPLTYAEGYVNGKYYSIDVPFMARVYMSFGSGYLSIHSHNGEPYPTPSHDGKSSDIGISEKYNSSKHFIYWRQTHNFYQYEGRAVSHMY